MRIAIIAAGSRGDVQPYVALGVGLLRAGHSVRLVTHEDFEALVVAHGLVFWPLAGNVQNIAQGAAMRERLEGGQFLRMMAQMAEEAKRGAVLMAEAALVACQGVDLVIAGLGGLFVALAVADKLALPLVQAYYIPFLPTSSYPSFLFPRLPGPLAGAYNRLTHQLLRQMMWQAFRPADRLARRQVLALPPAPLAGPFDATCLRGQPVLYGFSPVVIPPPTDAQGVIQVTGYWFLEPEADWTPSDELTAFLEAGPPPVYVGFGSMSSRRPQETAELVVQALAQAGQRGILLSGWGGLQPRDLPDSMMMIASAPFSWLFPRMAAVVHHGGTGTTAEGLRAGVPSVVVPFFADQPFWGRRVVELGVGPTPLPKRKLTVEELTRAIKTAVTDEAMRRRAAEVGARIRAEDGVARAVEIIGRI